MRKTVFTKSIKILIVSLLLLAVFFRKEHSQKLMALAFILWAVVTIGILLFRQSGKLFKKCCALYSALKQKIAQMMETSEETPSSAPVQASDSRETETMLLHISLRITEKLKSAYPQSVWQWKDTPSLQNILAGGTMRIKVENMDTYTHADISFDRFGRKTGKASSSDWYLCRWLFYVMTYENPCFHAYWLLCFKFQLSGTGIYNSPFVACFFSQLPFPFCNLALHIVSPDRQGVMPCRFPFIIGFLRVVLNRSTHTLTADRQGCRLHLPLCTVARRHPW